MASDGRWAINIRDGSTGTTLSNNILYNSHGSAAASPSRRQPHRPRQRLQRGDEPLHDRRRRQRNAGAMAHGHRPGHPLAHRGARAPIRQRVADDYHLKLAPPSPAKDAGLTLAAVTVDIDGVVRPSGPAVDIGAYEVPVSAHTLTVTRRGSATGTVTSSPAGISCGATCSAAFSPGASVTLTAAPAGGAGFVRWTGACSGTLPQCTVTMTAALTATATFGGIFTDDPLSAGATVVKAAHVLDLRAAIDSLRAWRSLSAISWIDQVLTAGVTPISATHLTQLRGALDGVYAADGFPPPAWDAAPDRRRDDDHGRAVRAGRAGRCASLNEGCPGAGEALNPAPASRHATGRPRRGIAWP